MSKVVSIRMKRALDSQFAKRSIVTIMRRHKGMRPQKIAVLLKVVVLNDSGKAWHQKDLAKELFISNSEISESLNRSSLAKLIDFEKRRVQRHSFIEFLKYGFRFVFPQRPGAIVNGVPTAHSHP